MTDAEAAAHLHEVMVLNDRIIALEGDCAHLLRLCAQAQSALQETTNTLRYSTGYIIPDYIPVLMSELLNVVTRANE